MKLIIKVIILILICFSIFILSLTLDMWLVGVVSGIGFEAVSCGMDSNGWGWIVLLSLFTIKMMFCLSIIDKHTDLFNWE